MEHWTLENLHDITFPDIAENVISCVHMFNLQILAVQSHVQQTVSMDWIDLLIATAVRHVNVVCDHHSLL